MWWAPAIAILLRKWVEFKVAVHLHHPNPKNPCTASGHGFFSFHSKRSKCPEPFAVLGITHPPSWLCAWRLSGGLGLATRCVGGLTKLVADGWPYAANGLLTDSHSLAVHGSRRPPLPALSPSSGRLFASVASPQTASGDVQHTALPAKAPFLCALSGLRMCSDVSVRVRVPGTAKTGEMGRQSEDTKKRSPWMQEDSRGRLTGTVLLMHIG